jgi:WD40 repeat protein
MLWPVNLSPGHKFEVDAIAVTPDGIRAISGSNDGTFILWDLTSGKEIHSGTGFERTLAISPDGRTAIIGSYDYTCFLWDLTTGTEIKRFYGHEGGITGIEYTPDGKRVLTCAWDFACILWDSMNGEVVFTLEGDRNCVCGIAITPDGKRAITSSFDETCILWDLATGKPISSQNFSSKVWKVVITPDGKRGVCYGEGDSYFLWNLITGEITVYVNPYSDWKPPIVISPDGKRAISGSSDNCCIIWSTETKEKLEQFVATAAITKASFYPGGIIAGDENGRIFILNGPKELLSPGRSIVTIRKIWDHELKKYQEPSADCPNCGTRFPPPEKVIVSIMDITKKTNLKHDQSPYFELPKEYWNDPGLLCKCPGCGEELQFNPFIAGGN